MSEEKKVRVKSAETLKIEKMRAKMRAEFDVADAKAAREAAVKKHDARVAKAEEALKALGE